MTSAERVLRLARFLASRRTGAGYAELTETFGVTERTARRDLDLLRKCGFVIGTRILDDGTHRFVLDALPPSFEEFRRAGGRSRDSPAVPAGHHVSDCSPDWRRLPETGRLARLSAGR
mgnify:FL=1